MLQYINKKDAKYFKNYKNIYEEKIIYNILYLILSQIQKKSFVFILILYKLLYNIILILIHNLIGSSSLHFTFDSVEKVTVSFITNDHIAFSMKIFTFIINTSIILIKKDIMSDNSQQPAPQTGKDATGEERYPAIFAGYEEGKNPNDPDERFPKYFGG